MVVSRNPLLGRVVHVWPFTVTVVFGLSASTRTISPLGLKVPTPVATASSTKLKPHVLVGGMDSRSRSRLAEPSANRKPLGASVRELLPYTTIFPSAVTVEPVRSRPWIVGSVCTCTPCPLFRVIVKGVPAACPPTVGADGVIVTVVLSLNAATAN